METMSAQPIFRNNQKPDQLIQKLNNVASSLKAKKEQGKERLKSQIQRLEEFLCSIPKGIDGHGDVELSNLRQEIIRRKEECELQVKEIERKKIEVQIKKEKLTKVIGEHEEQQAKSEKMYPRVRYSVNLYRDISHIKWHSDVENNEVVGFISTKCGIKTFRFDKSKQSQFFITNSLWDMGDES